MPTLHLLTGPRAGARWPVLKRRFVIGRDKGCDLVLDESVSGPSTGKGDVVSRQHAVLTGSEDTWVIEDGDGQGKPSRNGTLVNGRRVRDARPLRDGDRVHICHNEFAFHLDPSSTFSVEATVSHENLGPALDRQPAERLRRLLDISAALRGVLDADSVLAVALEHLFRLFPGTTRGLVVFRDTPTGELTVRAVRDADDGPPDPRFSTTVIRGCLETLDAILGNDLTNQFPNSDSVGSLPARPLLCAPLWTTEGEALGAIQLDTRLDGVRYSPDDLRLLLGAACQVSVALSNARLHNESLATVRYRQDVRVGEEVQRALLPERMPGVPGYEFAAEYKAARQVGGDYYDFVPLPDGRLAVLLGDVEGKGVPAGLVMAKFGAEARVCLELEADPSAAVARLNDRMCRAGPGKFVTLAVVVLDPVSHTAVVMSAGHPSPLLLRRTGAIEEIVPEDSGGPVIGVAPGAEFPSACVGLEPGDRVLLYSDGVSEAMDANDQQFDLTGIRAAVSGAGGGVNAVAERLLAAVRSHAAGCDQSDDIALVCFGRTATN